jgi:hypothetical protein
MNGVIDKEEEVFLRVDSNMFIIGTITLPKFKMGTLVLTTEVLGVDFGTKDLIFDFPHNLDEINVDTTPMCIKVQHMKFTCWNLSKDNASMRPKFRF